MMSVFGKTSTKVTGPVFLNKRSEVSSRVSGAWSSIFKSEAHIL